MAVLRFEVQGTGGEALSRGPSQMNFKTNMGHGNDSTITSASSM